MRSTARASVCVSASSTPRWPSSRAGTRGQKTETATDISDTLRDYWATGTGTAVSRADVRSAAWQNGHPWSAAFISWVMHTAGAAMSFDYSAAHAQYIATAKKSREAGDATKFQAYRIEEAAPEAGDLVCKDRKVCVQRNEQKKCVRQDCSGTTYENVARGRSSHSDIVVEVDAAKNRIRTIGGNVNQSVGEKWIALDDRGRLPERAKDGCRFIAVLKPPPGATAVSQGFDAPNGRLQRLPARRESLAHLPNVANALHAPAFRGRSAR